MGAAGEGWPKDQPRVTRSASPPERAGPPLGLCLVGGTFDRVHDGHLLLLRTAAAAAERVQVWITDDGMAAAKASHVQSWEARADHIRAWSEREAPGRISVHRLQDTIGPAATCPDCHGIASTPETYPGCVTINRLRREAGLEPLEILGVPHLLGEDGKVVSSSRIRGGRIDRRGRAWLPLAEQSTDQRMPAVLDPELKQPMGELFAGPEADPAVAMRAALATLPQPLPPVIAVGDVTVQTLLELGHTPRLAVIDGRTKRALLPVADRPSTDGFTLTLTADNPPGLLTGAFKEALGAALRSEGEVVVDVEGEEDLAPIPLLLMAPLGHVLLYGQPGEGVVLRHVEEEVKARARRLLDAFEPVDDDTEE